MVDDYPFQATWTMTPRKGRMSWLGDPARTAGGLGGKIVLLKRGNHPLQS